MSRRAKPPQPLVIQGLSTGEVKSTHGLSKPEAFVDDFTCEVIEVKTKPKRIDPAQERWEFVQKHGRAMGIAGSDEVAKPKPARTLVVDPNSRELRLDSGKRVAVVPKGWHIVGSYVDNAGQVQYLLKKNDPIRRL